HRAALGALPPAARGPSSGAQLPGRLLGSERDPPTDRPARVAAAVRADLAQAEHAGRVRARPAGRHARTPDPRLVARLRTAGCVFAEDEARLLEGAASGAALAELVARRVQGEPLEHLLGYVDFAGRRFLVAPGVFVLRGRSEL